MKKTKRFLTTALLCVLLVFLCSCGGNSKIVGTWTANLNMSQGLLDKMVQQDPAMKDFDGELIMPAVFTFYDNGTVMVHYVPEVGTEAMNNYIADLTTFMQKRLYAEMSTLGMDESQVDEFMQKTMGTTMDAYIDAALRTANPEDMVKKALQQGVYKVRGNKLYMDQSATNKNEYDQISISGNTFTLTDVTKDSKHHKTLPYATYPITFTKMGE